MNRNRLLLVLALALGCGTVASALSVRYLRAQSTRSPEPVAPVLVVVAARELPVGHVIGAADVKAVKWMRPSPPAEAIDAPAAVVGRVVTARVAASQPVLPTALAAPGVTGGLPVRIPAGLRAVSVRVDEVVGVSGFALAGTRVDVFGTFESGGQEAATTRLILQNVEVVAAGTQLEHDPAGKPQTVTVVTLLVSPQQAERLVLAVTTGRIQLALRNGQDDAEVVTAGVRVDALVAARAAQPAAAPERPAPRRAPRATEGSAAVEVINGNTRTVVAF